jgi:hypothetical protein
VVESNEALDSSMIMDNENATTEVLKKRPA